MQTNTDYTIAARLDVSNVVSTLWLNPTAETNAGVTATDTASTITVTSYGFREDGSSGTIGNFFVDDLRVGTTFSDVVTNAPVLERPVIVASPQNQTVTNGANVTFSVTASGTPPLGLSMAVDPDIGYRGSRHKSSGSDQLQSHADGGDVRPSRLLCLPWSPTPSVRPSATPVALSVWCASAPAFSYLTYNVHGNGLTNWSTNMWHVQAIGRQMQYLNPDIITFNEIPVTNNCTAQMVDFVTAFRPGYYLVTNSTDDGFIRSVILSRYPIVSSTSWLHASDLTPYGYSGSGFTRDLFEAQISVPGFSQPLHVFAVHLKSGQDSDSSAKRAAGGGRHLQFFRHGLFSRPITGSLTC